MANMTNPQALVDAEVFDPSGDKIGKVGEVYLRDDSQQPAWIMVKSGLFNSHETMVPLQGARMSEQGIQVGVTKEKIKEAPRLDPQGHLSEQDSMQLYRYYGIRPEVPNSRGPVDGPRPDARGPAEMIRSEERLNVGTERVESGRVRLRKYVVTEQQQVTVPVSHEEVRVEREPIDATERGRLGDRSGKLADAEQEVVLHEEKPVVRTETVPVERVRVGTDTVTEDQTVGGEVHKERIDVEPDRQAKNRRG
ncbi:MAG TPA: PRC and DUF2382 domain-containing protein [Pseudonocardiaceae bacterium]|nr:PRC and DUF2382 domain-containing protein [Pseudonocardiaceae bacterium]